MSKTETKRDKLLRILDGDEGLIKVIDREDLQILEEITPPPLYSPTLVWLAGTLAICFFSAIVLYLIYPVSPLSGSLWVGLSLGAFIALWALEGKVKADALAYYELLLNAHGELLELHDFLQDHLKEVDQRARDYFHSVTNTKTTSYFVLMQIRHRLEAKVSATDELLRVPEKEAMLEAKRLLTGKFDFPHGLHNQADKTHRIQITKLNGLIGRLSRYLEDGLDEIEQDLRRTME
jgi:hypothetical protein